MVIIFPEGIISSIEATRFTETMQIRFICANFGNPKLPSMPDIFAQKGSANMSENITPAQWLRAELEERDYRIEETDGFFHCRLGRAPEALIRVTIDTISNTVSVHFTGYYCNWSIEAIWLSATPGTVILATIIAAEEQLNKEQQ